MRIYLVLLALFESLGLFFAFYLGVYLRFDSNLGLGEEALGSLLPRAVIFSLVLMLALVAVGLYRPRNRISSAETMLRILTALVLATFANTSLYYLLPGISTWRGSVALSLIAAFLFIMLSRVVFHLVIDNNRLRRNVLVVGSGQMAASLSKLCSTIGRCSFRFVGYLAVRGDESDSRCSPVFTDEVRLAELVKEKKVDEIVVAMDDRRECFPSRELLDCRFEGVKVTEELTFLERETGKIDLEALRPSWLIYGRGFRQGSAHRVFKRAFDILASSVLLIGMLPVLLVSILAILIESRGRGGVLYRQERVGLHGEPFALFKLRSMIQDAEVDGRPQWAAKNDPRVTRVGAFLRRFRIDELPQIFNILKGEMSFVGPRPERREFVDELSVQLHFYQERHCVKPGLTGWAQLCYPYGSSVEDAKQKLQYDLYYVKNYSPAFDLLILIQTLDAVLWKTERPHEYLGVASDQTHLNLPIDLSASAVIRSGREGERSTRVSNSA